MLLDWKKHIIALLALLVVACGGGGGNSNDNSQKETPTKIMETAKPQARNYGEVLLVAGSDNLSLFKGDIEKSCTDVVVNAANPWLADGGGVAGAIYAAAGKENLDQEIMNAFEPKLKGAPPAMGTGEELKLLNTTETYISDAYDIKQKYGTSRIIHALSPDFSYLVGKYEEGYAQLSTTYQNIFRAMALEKQKNGYTSISIPPLSALNFAGAADKARIYNIMFDEIKSAADEYPKLQIMACLRDPKVFEQAKEYFKAAFKKKVVFVATTSLSLHSYQLSEHKLAIFEDRNSLTHKAFYFSNLALVEQKSKGIEVFGGTKVKNSVVGLGVESMWEQSTPTHTTFKLSAITPVLSSTCGISLGYMNLYPPLYSKVARKLSRSFALSNSDMSWNGFSGEVFTRFIKSFGDIKFSTSLGIKTLFNETIVNGAYLGVTIETCSGSIELACTNTAAKIGLMFNQ